MSGWLFLGIMALVSVSDVLIGLNFIRKADREVGAAPKPDATPPEAARKFGRILMIAGALMFLFALSVSFGLTPIDGIDPIQFAQE